MSRHTAAEEISEQTERIPLNDVNDRVRVVAFVTCGAAMAGVEFNAIRLARRLDPKRWRIILISSEEGDLPSAFRHAGLEVKIAPRVKLYSTSIALGGKLRLPNPAACAWDIGALLAAGRGLASVLSELMPDLVVTKGLFAHFYGGIGARQAGVPCLWHTEDFISERYWGLFRRCFGLAARYLPTELAVIGEPIAQQLPIALQERVRVIHNGADTTAFRPGADGSPVRRELGISQDALVVGHVGRLTHWKGQRYLLEAFAQFTGKVPRARLLLVGSPMFDSHAYENSLRARVATLGLTDRVTFAGYRRDVAQVLAAMDVLAYTSIEKDNCPLALLEAMASGLPVAAFDIPGIRLVVRGSTDGILVPVERVDLLAQALVDLLTKDDLRRRLAQGARWRIEEAFSLDLHVRRFEETFVKLIEKKKGAMAGAAAWR